MLRPVALLLLLTVADGFVLPRPGKLKSPLEVHYAARESQGKRVQLVTPLIPASSTSALASTTMGTGPVTEAVEGDMDFLRGVECNEDGECMLPDWDDEFDAAAKDGKPAVAAESPRGGLLQSVSKQAKRLLELLMYPAQLLDVIRRWLSSAVEKLVTAFKNITARKGQGADGAAPAVDVEALEASVKEVVVETRKKLEVDTVGDLDATLEYAPELVMESLAEGLHEAEDVVKGLVDGAHEQIQAMQGVAETLGEEVRVRVEHAQAAIGEAIEAAVPHDNDVPQLTAAMKAAEEATPLEAPAVLVGEVEAAVEPVLAMAAKAEEKVEEAVEKVIRAKNEAVAKVQGAAQDVVVSLEEPTPKFGGQGIWVASSDEDEALVSGLRARLSSLPAESTKWVTDMDLLRYAKSCGLDDPWERLKATCAWRAEMEVDARIADADFSASPLNKELFWLDSPDKEGNPVLVFRTGLHRPQQVSNRAFSLFLIHLLEEGRRRFGVGRTSKLTLLCDRHNAGMASQDFTLVTEVVPFLLAHYPGMLQRAHVAPVNWWMYIIKSIIDLFLDESTRGRVNLISGDQTEIVPALAELFDASLLPDYLGGSSNLPNWRGNNVTSSSVWT